MFEYPNTMTPNQVSLFSGFTNKAVIFKPHSGHFTSVHSCCYMSSLVTVNCLFHLIVKPQIKLSKLRIRVILHHILHSHTVSVNLTYRCLTHILTESNPRSRSVDQCLFVCYVFMKLPNIKFQGKGTISKSEECKQPWWRNRFENQHW